VVSIGKVSNDNPATLQKETKKDPALLAAEGVAKDFETMYVDMMLKAMRQTAKPEEESNAQGIYQGMLDEEYSKSMSASHDFGIKSMLLDWMKTNDPKLSASNDVKKALQQYKNDGNVSRAQATPK
jgi:peptidoglycan hydrolase FlgJ